MGTIAQGRILIGALALAATCFPARAPAQAVLIDQGVFRLLQSGREIGRDSFDIRRTGSGENARLQAQGWVERDGRRIQSVLETTPAYAVTGYQATLVSGGATTRVRAQVTARRLELTVVSPAGEQTREARAPANAVLLDGHGVHAYFFVAALASTGATLPVLVPGFEEGGELVVQSIAAETLNVAGQAVEARQIRVAGREGERRLWVDAQGRVLRLEVPGTGFLAERLRPPP